MAATEDARDRRWSLSDPRQRATHGVAGQAHVPVEGLRKLDQQEEGAGDAERRGEEGHNDSWIGRREKAEAGENQRDPDDQHRNEHTRDTAVALREQQEAEGYD